MGVSAVACPYCGQTVVAEDPTDGRTGSARRGLKAEYRASRNTCPKCGRQYDIRRP